MTTNLLIGNAGVGLRTLSVACNNTADTRYPATNLLGGNKTDYFRLATATSGDTRITINTTASQTANFLYLGKANTLKKGGVGTITLRGHSSNNYAGATTITTVSSFGSASLVGPDEDDYITTFATTASYPWWFINYNAASASYVHHAKCFVGQLFDSGRDPTGIVSSVREQRLGANRRSAYTFDLSFEGMSYAKAVEMYQRFYFPRRHQPVILTTTSYHDILFGHRVLYGRIINMTTPPRQTGSCDVTMTFQEMP
jgi:hypothetical protein